MDASLLPATYPFPAGPTLTVQDLYDFLDSLPPYFSNAFSANVGRDSSGAAVQFSITSNDKYLISISDIKGDLAARMGMRVGDIRDLTFERMDWEHNCIRLAQAKTGVPLELPLSEEVGQAIIDYLRHGRPTTDDRHIFIRHHAPFEAFGQDNNLHWIITSYRRKAGIKLPRQSKSGLHSLRHTLASRLLEAGVPLETIAGTLGHLATDSTRQYLRIDVNELRRAALDTEEVFHE